MSFPPADEDGFTLDDAIRLSGVSRETGPRITRYIAALDAWRSRLNLIGPGEGRHLWRRHVFDSLQLALLIRPEETSIADLGTGAGFPGMILACAFPERDVALIEKSPKKCEFLRAAVSSAGLNAQVLNQRTEDPVPKQYDLVVSRALSPLPRLLGQAYPWLIANGRSLFIKGQGVLSELTQARDSWSFDLESHVSQTNPDGQILAISQLRPGQR
jgi:16S rRNA (guanine527-N7)-methyltransferase